MRVVLHSLTLGMPVSARPISAMTLIDEDSWPAIRVLGEEPPPLTYILQISSSDGGTVVLPGEGSFEYDAGDTIVLEAAPIAGYEFVEWTGDTATIADRFAASTSITMDDDYSISAVFQPIPVAFGGLRGHIYDKETGLPLQDVTAAFQNYSTQTDADGYYELVDLPVGTHDVGFLKAGYQLATRQATIVEDQWATLDVELTPGEGPEPEREFPWWIVGVAGAVIVGVVAKRELGKR